MGSIAFSDYISSRPAATTPVDSADTLIVLQGGVVKLVASDDVGMVIPSTLIDASLSPVTLLPASGEIVYEKTDASDDVAGFAVSVLGQTMCQELQNGLAGQFESIRVKLIGTNWYKIA